MATVNRTDKKIPLSSSVNDRLRNAISLRLFTIDNKKNFQVYIEILIQKMVIYKNSKRRYKNGKLLYNTKTTIASGASMHIKTYLQSLLI